MHAVFTPTACVEAEMPLGVCGMDDEVACMKRAAHVAHHKNNESLRDFVVPQFEIPRHDSTDDSEVSQKNNVSEEEDTTTMMMTPGAAAALVDLHASATAHAEYDISSRDVAAFVAARIHALRADAHAPMKPPVSISLHLYLHRVTKMLKVHKHCLLAGLVYAERLSQLRFITGENMHRIALVSCLLASKHHQDIPYTNQIWSKTSGTHSLKELNTLEREALVALDWSLNVPARTFSVLMDQAMEYRADIKESEAARGNFNPAMATD